MSTSTRPPLIVISMVCFSTGLVTGAFWRDVRSIDGGTPSTNLNAIQKLGEVSIKKSRPDVDHVPIPEPAATVRVNRTLASQLGRGRPTLELFTAMRQTMAAELVNREYDSLFIALNTGKAETARLKSDILDLFEIKTQMLYYADVLAHARANFKSNAKILLDDSYSQFLESENEVMARREYGSFAAFAESVGLRLDAENAQKIQSLIRQAEAYSKSTLTNYVSVSPLEESPLPMWGAIDRAMVDRAKADARGASDSGQRVKTAATEAGLDSSVITALEQYYQRVANSLDARAEELDGIATEISSAKDPSGTIYNDNNKRSLLRDF